MMHFHITVKLVSMPFNEDYIQIKNLYLLPCMKVVERISK